MPATSPASDADGSTLDNGAPLITSRAVVLGVLTIAASFYYYILISWRQGSGPMTGFSQYPLAAFMPFVVWIFANVLLKLTVPRLALRQGELLTLFAMTWVVAVIPDWMGSWVATLTGATQFASVENQWAEVFFNFVPWHVFPPATQRITDNFWYGLPAGMAVPWDGWIGPLLDWLGVSLAVVVFGYCLLVVFQHQWENAEKLSFPLAQLPVDLTDGFDGRRRFPRFFYQRLFWVGFAVVFVPQLYNISTYFTPGIPTFDLFWAPLPLPVRRRSDLGLHPRHAADADGDLSVPGGHPGKHVALPRREREQEDSHAALRHAQSGFHRSERQCPLRTSRR